MTEALAEEKNLPATTTHAQDLTTAGQRRINIIWEITQAIIASVITGATIYCAIFKIQNAELTNAFFLIVGFYFSRTNHSNIGGVGVVPNQTYEGR